MASHTTLTIVFCFWAAFWCLQLLEAGEIPKPSQSRVARLAAGAFLPAVVAAFALALLLLFAHARSLGRANAAGGRSLGRLTKATLAATMAALLSGAVLRLVAAGVLGGADDLGWLNTKRVVDW